MIDIEKEYVTVSGHKVEITKIKDDPHHSHPIEGFIFNRYRGVEKSKAEWMADGRMNQFDNVFCLVGVPDVADDESED